MSKRFTDTAKWDDRWFSDLTIAEKLAYQYVLDKCDNAGVWEANTRLANFQIGQEIDWPALAEKLGDRVQILDGDKWWMTKFIGFQFGELSENSRVHQSVIRIIKDHGIPFGYPSDSLSDRLKDKDKEKDKDKDKDKVLPRPPSKAELIYDAYPKKVGKAKALKSIEGAITTTGDADRLLQQTRSFAKAVEQWPQEDRRYIKHPSTWFNQGCYDDDPSEWVRKPLPPAGGNGHSGRWDPLGLL